MNPAIKKIAKIVTPRILYNYLKLKKNKFSITRQLFKSYQYDLKRYYKFSDFTKSDTQIILIGKIIKEYHAIEKGLTMPQPRLGFGKELVLSLSDTCEKYITCYNKQDDQLIHALSVLQEYKHLHDIHNYQLDEKIITAIQKSEKYTIGIKTLSQKETSKVEYFKNNESPFPVFSNSRASVRNYTTEEVQIEKIIDVLELVRNTPSACNRQSWRTYVFSTDEQLSEILAIQGGNRGFGHLANKLIIITGELGVFSGIAERNQVYIDGGMYAMNLLYSLHYYQIAACILNCSLLPSKDLQLRNLCKVKDSEVFIAMIACGNPPESFKIAASKRSELSKTYTKNL